jgi:hypothetical protein
MDYGCCAIRLNLILCDSAIFACNKNGSPSQ